MTEQALDDLIRRMMLDAARQEYGSLMEELPEHDFSQEFERKMQKLICRTNHPIWHRMMRAVACLLLALLLSAGAVLTVSPEARAAFTGWVREVYETSFIYRFFGTEPETLGNVIFRPTYVPDGWQIKEESVSVDLITTIVYRNDAGDFTAFSYFPRGISPTIQVVGDGREIYRHISVNGMSAELYLDQDEGEANVLLWKDEKEGALFCMSSPLGETELIKIAESVKAVPATWRPTWLPEGYETFDESSGVPAHQHYMLDGKCVDLSILQEIESAAMYVTMEEGDVEKKVRVSGRSADLYMGARGGNRALIWADDNKGLAFMLITDPEIAEQEIIRIAESVRPALTPEQPHRPAWVPSEYALRGKSAGYKNIELHYDAESGKQILFRYWAAGYADDLLDELRETVNNLTPQSTLVNGFAAWFYADAGGVNHLVWHGGESDDTYWITAPLPGGELIKIAQSVGSTQAAG